MEKTTVKAQSKYLKQSPYKMRLVLNLIRGLDVQDALNVLTFTKRKSATEIKQLLESAIANAEANYNLNSSINTTRFSYMEFSAASPIATDISPSFTDTSGFLFFLIASIKAKCSK